MEETQTGRGQMVIGGQGMTSEAEMTSDLQPGRVQRRGRGGHREWYKMSNVMFLSETQKSGLFWAKEVNAEGKD